MSDQDVAKIEADLLRRLKEGLEAAHFGTDSTVEDVRAFLIRTFDSLRTIAEMVAGDDQEAQRPSTVVIAFPTPTNPNSRSRE